MLEEKKLPTGIGKSRVYSFAFVVAFIGLICGYHYSIISGVMLFLDTSFSLSLLMKQQLVSMLLVGAMIGVLINGIVADHLGRKWALIVSLICLLFGASFFLWGRTEIILLVGRFVTGIGVGLASLVVPLYLSEISLPKQRGWIIASFQLAITVGIVLGYFINYLLADSLDWRMAYYLVFFISLLELILLFFIPETPSWLLLQGREKPAFALLKLLHPGEKHQHMMEQMKEKLIHKKFHINVSLARRGLMIPLVVGIVLSLLQQITGINTIIYYSPIIFYKVGFAHLDTTLSASLFIGIVNVLATMVALWMIHVIGRRTLLLWGLFVMALSLAMLSFFGFYPVSGGYIASLLSIALYVIAFAVSLGPIVWIVVAEIFPLKARGRSMSIAIFVNWLGNYLVSLLFLPLMEYAKVAGVFALFAIICILGWIFVMLFVPETRGKSLEEIQECWKK